MKRIIRLIPLLALTPIMVLAQGELTEVTSFLDNIVKFISDTLTPLLFAVAFLVFLWGVVKYFIIGREGQNDKDDGRKYMMFGILAFVFMVSVWGIVNLISDGFGLDDDRIQNIPNVDLRNN